MSLEYKWLQTRYGPVPINRENHHVNAAFAVFLILKRLGASG